MNLLYCNFSLVFPYPTPTKTPAVSFANYRAGLKFLQPKVRPSPDGCGFFHQEFALFPLTGSTLHLACCFALRTLGPFFHPTDTPSCFNCHADLFFLLNSHFLPSRHRFCSPRLRPILPIWKVPKLFAYMWLLMYTSILPVGS